MEHILQQIQPRDVIITTNLGTRGMDIQASAVEGTGGLHVILTYVPANTRIVRQAFGRTARKGNLGSGQFIVKDKTGLLDPMGLMQHIKNSEFLELEKYFSHEWPSVLYKDEVYSRFLAHYSQLCGKISQPNAA